MSKTYIKTHGSYIYEKRPRDSWGGYAPGRKDGFWKVMDISPDTARELLETHCAHRGYLLKDVTKYGDDWIMNKTFVVLFPLKNAPLGLGGWMDRYEEEKPLGGIFESPPPHKSPALYNHDGQYSIWVFMDGR